MSDRAAPSEYRDSSGKRLADYPRPSVAVDTALLTTRPEPGGGWTLCVLQCRPNGPGRRGWGLPGTFLHQGERLADAVRRSLADKAGVRGREPRQLWVFDDPSRDARGWVLSVAHIDVLAWDKLTPVVTGRTDVRPMPTEAPGRLTYDHATIIDRAVAQLRAEYARRPDPFHLLPTARFTLRELRLLHEAVAGTPLQRDNFRRAMEPGLVGTGTSTTGARGRPAELFSRSADGPTGDLGQVGG